jgi:hypothetical protein
MSNPTIFNADHTGFYLNGAPFFPLIQDGAHFAMDWSNAALIRLPAHLSDDLDWSEQKALAEQIVLKGKYLFWEIDLGLGDFQFKMEDSASFYSFSLALEEFSKKLWPVFQNHTFGVALYRGLFKPLQSFPIARWETAFLEWSAEFRCKTQPDYEVYCAQVLSEYLHRLVSFLPETALPFVLIDASEIFSPTKVSQLFSRERFEHLHLALKGIKAPFSGICWEEGHRAQGWLGSTARVAETPSQPSLGIYLPKDAYIDPALLQKLDILLLNLQEKKVLFRIVAEEKLTEQWDGLDKLIVPSCALSPQGRRKLLGFIAAGGIISTLGDPIGLPEEELVF